MKRVVVGVCGLWMLACGGAVDSAKQAAQEKVEQELAERAIEALTDVENLNITNDGNTIEMTVDGKTLTAGTDQTVPADFPVATSGLTVGSVTRFGDGTQDLVTVTATGGPADLPDTWRAALTGSGWTLSGEQKLVTPEGTTTMFVAEKANEQIMVSHGASAGETQISLAWTKRQGG